jgi:hypothetical protein
VSAIGFLLVGFGILTMWSGFYRVNVFAVFRAILQNPTPAPGVKPGQPGHPVGG